MTSSTCKRRRNTIPRRSGAAVIEAALVLPIMFMMILGVMEYGRFLMVRHLFANATCAGAAYAARHTSPIVLNGTTYGNATSDVTNIVNSALAGQQLVGQTINVYQSDSAGNNLGTWTGAANASYVCVQITGTYQFTLPTQFLALPNTLNLTFQTVRRSEGN